MQPIALNPDDPNYPKALRTAYVDAPVLTVSRELTSAKHTIAIVGARDATTEAAKFAFAMAYELAEQGAVIVSGGATGIDTAAHEGALAAKGITWCVMPTSRTQTPIPPENGELFARIERSDGAMIWPFPDGSKPHHRSSFLTRNQWLAALADMLIVVQARRRSGSLHAAGCALKIGRAVRIVRPPAWDETEFAGSRQWIYKDGARALDGITELFTELGLKRQTAASTEATGTARTSSSATTSATSELPLTSPAPSPVVLEPRAATLFERVTKSPQHLDEIAFLAGIPTREAATLLLTLALENVVVEGPSAFYRRA